uniref:Dynein light chain n=1 Tax=Ditylenchus dipsaci TaxID=166011 RepID=A0A915DGY4_9BILA
MCKEATEKCRNDKEIATFIRKEFEKKFNGNWNCIVGSNFSSSVTAAPKDYIKFSVDNETVTLFRAS